MLVKEIDFLKDIFDAYPDQREFMHAVFSGEHQHFILNIHRRFGKDAAFFNCAWLYAAMVPGMHIYTLPKIAQARNVVWEGRDLEGVRWRDRIPKHLVASMNQTECKINFVNGSILHATGADNILNAHLGGGFRSLWVSEFQRTHPMIWDYLRPIVRRHKAIAAFNFTSLGKGHAYRLMQANLDNPKWYIRKLTCEDTKDNYGNRIITAEDIEEERRSGMEEDLIQQEYYCDDSVAVKGTYFAEQMKRVDNEGRILKLPIIKELPIHTCWDIGSRDTNSIWWFQVVGGGRNAKFHFLYQHDKTYGDIEYYLQLLQQKQKDFGHYTYGKHYFPHDTKQTEWTTGKSRMATLMKHKVTPTIVPIMRVIERVQVARYNFENCLFDEVGCKNGVEALRIYRAKYNDNTRSFTADEEHDWSSHPASAFCYGHVGYMDSHNQPAMKQQMQYARARR